MSFIASKSINGIDEIIFNDAPNAKQRYILNSIPVVGVTTAIKAGYPTSEALVNWKSGQAAEYAWNQAPVRKPEEGDQVIKEAKLAWKKEAEEAAGIGVVVHLYAELSSKNKRNEAIESLTKYKDSLQWNEIVNACYKVDDFTKQNKDEILFTEQIVGSTQHKFAGRFDRLVKRDGKVIISDYKTSKSFYIDQFIQDALYSIAIKEWLGLKVEGFEVIRFGKEGGDFEPLLINDPEEIKELTKKGLDCLDDYNFIKKWGKDLRFKYK